LHHTPDDFRILDYVVLHITPRNTKKPIFREGIVIDTNYFLPNPGRPVNSNAMVIKLDEKYRIKMRLSKPTLTYSYAEIKKAFVRRGRF